MSRRSQTFAVLGLGTFGRAVALELQRFGNSVLGIDADDAVVGDIADELTSAVIADVRSEDALREAGVDECDAAVIAMATDLEASVMAAINCRMLGVETIWAKATTRTHHRILSKLGVDRIVHPEEEQGRHLAQVLHNPFVRDYVSVGNGFSVVNFTVPKGLAGRTLDGLKLMDRHRLRCVGVMRGSEFIGSDALSCQLHEEDRLLLLGKRADLREFAGTL